ncbi:MAG: AI-2E family transporter [Phormidesmis sp.]
MSFRQLPRWLLWSLVLPLVILNGWAALKLFEYFQSIFTVAIAATLVAFILDYPVAWFQQFRLSRGGAVGVVLLIGAVGLGIAGLTLFPLLFEQVDQLSQRLPDWISSSSQHLDGIQTWATQRNIPVNIPALLARVEGYLGNQAESVSGLVLALLTGAIANVLDVFLALVLTIYLLSDGEEIWRGLFRWLPVTFGRRLQPALTNSFHNYFVSQAAVSLMLGLTMTVAFLIIQVPFGLLFGLAVGVMGLVPFGAGLAIVLVSCVTALKSVWLGLRVLVVAAVIDQVIEQAIAPSLIGNFIGLNPVWILVSLLIGAKVLGFLGLVLAVPIASAIKSLLTPPPPPERPEQTMTDTISPIPLP